MNNRQPLNDNPSTSAAYIGGATGSVVNIRMPSRNPNKHNLRDIRQSLGPRRPPPSSAGYPQQQTSVIHVIDSTSPQQYTLSNTHTVSINGASVYNSAANTAAPCLVSGSIPAVPLTKLRPDRKEALNQIKQSLLPFDNSFNSSSSGSMANYASESTNGGFMNFPVASATNTDTLSSESSCGSADVNYLQEFAMLECLVSMGFDRDAAFYALKLTQFRHIQHAVEILLKTNSTHVYGKSHLQRKTSFETADGSSSRSESPMAMQQQPMGHAPSPSHQSFGAVPAQNQQRTLQHLKLTNGSPTYASFPPSPDQPLLHRAASPMAPLCVPQKTAAEFKRCHVTVNEPMDQLQSLDAQVSYTVRQTILPVVQHTALSKKVERPVAQSAEPPSLVQSDRTAATSTAAVSGSRAGVGTPPSDPHYLERLFQRVSNVLTSRVGPGSHLLTGPNGMILCKRDSAASSSSENSGTVSANHADIPSTVGGVPSTSLSQSPTVFVKLTDQSPKSSLPSLVAQAQNAAYVRNITQPAMQNGGAAVAQFRNCLDYTNRASRNQVGGVNKICIQSQAHEVELTDQSAAVCGTPKADIYVDRGRNEPTNDLAPFRPPRNASAGRKNFWQDAKLADSPAKLSNTDNGAVIERVESPMPETLLKRLKSVDIGQPLNRNLRFAFKPCTPQALKFFMEQHVENVIKQHKERQRRSLELEKEMQKANFSAQVQCHMRNLLKHKESQYLRLKRQKMDASLFTKIQTIGVGAFGEVTLVMKKDTKTLFAMKTLRKSDVIKKNQAAHVKAERDILSEADNEWVVKLYYSFQDRDNLFFIMEYIPGGDMMALLIKKGIFEEHLARFYIAELVCAIESVHKLKFIHRDIKPDNILIDQNGHIKLTDFGLCTGLRWTHDWKRYADQPVLSGHAHQDSFDLLQMREPSGEHKILDYRQQRPRRKAHSLVGTPNYIAPEVLLRIGHTVLCDFWSVGVILYEMVVGHPPFLANSPEETQLKVVHWRETLCIPRESQLSPACENLILSLCRAHEDRLGRLPGAADIKEHEFFKDIDWNNLRRMKAPYKPEILHATDTSNFDPVEPRFVDDRAETCGIATTVTGQSPSTSLPDHAFYEFTFRRFFNSDGHGCPTLVDPLSNPRTRLEPVFEPEELLLDSPGSGTVPQNLSVNLTDVDLGRAIAAETQLTRRGVVNCRDHPNFWRQSRWQCSLGSQNVNVLRINAEEEAELSDGDDSQNCMGNLRLDEQQSGNFRLDGHGYANGNGNLRLDGTVSGANDGNSATACDSYYRVQERYGFYDRRRQRAGVYDSSSTATGGTLVVDGSSNNTANRLSFGSLNAVDSEADTSNREPPRRAAASNDSSVYV